MQQLESYSCPGNIWELENCIKYLGRRSTSNLHNYRRGPSTRATHATSHASSEVAFRPYF